MYAGAHRDQKASDALELELTSGSEPPDMGAGTTPFLWKNRCSLPKEPCLQPSLSLLHADAPVPHPVTRPALNSLSGLRLQ